MSMTDTLTSTISDGRKTQGRTPVYRATLNGSDLDITVSRMEMTLAEFQHDAVTITATSSTLTDTQTLKGKAISFFYGLAPNTELFYGYCDSVTDNQKSGGVGHLAFTMNCLGTTKEMQTGTPRFWNNSKIPNVVENLAYKGLLGFHGHDHPLTWGALSQTDESDWKYASNLAQRLGWSLFNRYGVIMLYNPSLLFRDNGPFIQLISSQYSSTAFQDYERALIEFQPIEDSDTAYRQIGRKISFFNGETVQTVTQQGDKYTVFKYLSNIVARNPDEAEVYANAPQYMAASWSQQATARVLGNASIFPGMSVDIFTTNPKYYKDRYNGRWLVRGAAHIADRQTFQTQLVLARPDSGAGISTSAYVPFWNQISGGSKLYAPKPRPNMMLSEGRWMSSWTNPSVRSVA